MRLPAARPWVRAVTLVALVNTGFLLLGLWLARLPREPLRQRIRAAFANGDLIENDWPWLESRRGFNQYDDCAILQMISNRDDSLWANAVAPLIYNKGRDETDRCGTLHTLVTEGPSSAPHFVYRYTRYWHGYNPVAAVLLGMFDLGRVRTLLKITAYGTLVLLLLAAGTRDRELLAVAGGITLTGTVFWSLPYFGQSLSQAPGDIFVVLGIACLIFWRDYFSRLATLAPFCAVYGAGVVYFEFLTGQLPTAAGLLLPVAYLVARLAPEPADTPGRAWRFALAALLAFGVGGLLTIAIKQGLAVVIVGPGALRTFLEYLHRYASPSPQASLQHFGATWSSPDAPLVWSTLKAIYALLGQGYILTYGSHLAALVLYAVVGLSWIVAGYLALRRPEQWARSDWLAFAAGGAVVLAWACTFQTHTTIHRWWMVRMLIVPISFGWGALAWQLMRGGTNDRHHLARAALDPARPGAAGVA